MEEFNNYQKGFIDGVVAVFASLLQEMDEKILGIVLDRLELKKTNSEENQKE